MRFIAGRAMSLPLAAIALGLILQGAADRALTLAPLWTFLLVFFSALAVAPLGGTRRELTQAGLIILASAVVTPLIVGLAAAALRIEGEPAALMALIAVAPVGPAVSAYCVALRIAPRTATLAAFVSLGLAPLLMPMGLMLAQAPVPLDIAELGRRVLLTAALPVLAAALVGFLAPVTVQRSVITWRAGAVLALVMLALARSAPLRVVAAEPLTTTLGILAIALAPAIIGTVVGWIVLRRLGIDAALAGGLAAGSRSVPVAWAAAGDVLTPLGHLAMALTIVPLNLQPMVLGLWVRWQAKRRPRPMRLAPTLAQLPAEYRERLLSVSAIPKLVKAPSRHLRSKQSATLAQWIF